MKKEKIIRFIDLLLSNKKINLDVTSIDNYKIIKYLIKNIDLHEIKNYKYIVKKSIPIIKKMTDTFKKYQDDYLLLKSINKIDYNTIRKELYGFPSFSEIKGVEIKKQIKTVNQKYYYKLKISGIFINLYFYGKEDKVLFKNIARIIFLFITTFGINLNLFNNYNIRLLLIDFPRKLDTNLQKNNTSFKNISDLGYFNNSSGVNIFSKKELVVTRKTGLSGLLIHELIHMVGLDFCFNFRDNSHVNISNWQRNWIKINNIKNVNSNIGSFIESICNSNSSYFLAIYNSIYLADKTSSCCPIKYFKYFFYLESIYCYLNAIKLLSYFNFKTYDSFFNNTNNKIFYQNALVFEYTILRMFIFSDYYKLLLKDMLKYDFNKKTNSDINLKKQNQLNIKLLDISKEKSLKIIFDSLSRFLKYYNDENNYMEYFLTNII